MKESAWCRSPLTHRGQLFTLSYMFLEVHLLLVRCTGRFLRLDLLEDFTEQLQSVSATILH